MVTSVTADRVRRLLRATFHVIGIVAMLLVLFEYGVLEPGSREIVAALGNGLLAGGATAVLLRAFVARDFRSFVARNQAHVLIGSVIVGREVGRRLLAGTAGGEVLGAPWLRHVLLGAMVMLELWAIVAALLTPRSSVREGGLALDPLRVMIASFPTLALVGAFLLLMPRSRLPGAEPLTFLDAFFTATSAVCVTGLTTRDPASELSTVGQTVVMILIQFGGLGIVTFAAFFSVLLGRRGSLEQRAAVSEALEQRPVHTAYELVTFIVVFTFVVEAVGAILLLDAWSAGVGKPLFERLRLSAFHSVSAFCNAGFSLEPGSLAGQRDDPLVLTVMGLLVVLGGLGFAVHHEIFGRIRERFHQRRPGPTLGVPGRRPRRLSLHARLVVRLSAWLIAGGGLALYALERLEHGEAGLGVGEAMFLSVSSRTAGFATSNLAELSQAGLLVVMLLMFVGASPGSTGGGIKTTTLGVMAAAIRSMWRQRLAVDLLRRSVSLVVVRSAFVIVSLNAILVAVATLCLLVAHPELDFAHLLFEVVSAVGTVGLSTGITPRLGGFAQVVLCVAMLLGRLGPLSMMVLLTRRHSRLTYRYPDEDVAVG